MSSSFVNVCPVVNLAYIIHVYFVILNVLNVVKSDTYGQFASNAKICNPSPIKLNVSNESYSNQIHDIILPDIRCSHNSCIFNEIIYKYAVDMAIAPNPDQNFDVILSDVTLPNDLFTSSDIYINVTNKF